MILEMKKTYWYQSSNNTKKGRLMKKYLFIIVGVGGTGSLLARDIPKLLLETLSTMLIVDGDIVEGKNMKRQSYQKQDIGENKAVALSAKINTFYGPICDASSTYITKNELQEKLKNQPNKVPVIIGCVDNDATRIILENMFNDLPDAIYMDSANSEYDGNVFVSYRENGVTYGPTRSKSYLLENKNHPLDKSCQELAATNTQFLVTNLKMATVLFEHCSSIMGGEIKAGVSVVKRFKTVHYKEK